MDTPEGKVAIYQLTASKLPPDQTFTLYVKDYFEKAPSRMRIFITNAEGRLQRKSSTAKDISFLEDTLAIQNSGRRGIERQYYLKSADDSICITTSFIPYPIEAISKDGAKASLSTTAALGNFFVLRLDGFQPSELVTLISQTSTERKQWQYRVNDTGHGSIIICENGLYDSGFGLVKIMRKDETLSLCYERGDLSERICETASEFDLGRWLEKCPLAQK